MLHVRNLALLEVMGEDAKPAEILLRSLLKTEETSQFSTMIFRALCSIDEENIRFVFSQVHVFRLQTDAIVNLIITAKHNALALELVGDLFFDPSTSIRLFCAQLVLMHMVPLPKRIIEKALHNESEPDIRDLLKKILAEI